MEELVNPLSAPKKPRRDFQKQGTIPKGNFTSLDYKNFD